MSLIPQSVALTPTQQAAARIRALAQSAYQATRLAQREGARLVWSNPAATPEEVFAAIGADAVQMCQLSEKNRELLALVGEPVPSPLPAGVTLRANQDGTVTVVRA